MVVFSGGGDPSGQYRDFSATAALIEEGRAEVADVLDRYVGTSQDLAPGAGAVRPAVSGDRYLLANDAPEAMDRFTAFATLFDPSTFRHLDGLGLAAGWRCWEVGAGGTTVVRNLAARVGPAGHVLATDINLAWAARAAAPNVEILEHDVAADPPPGGPFDLVHARLVLVHVPERDRALANMVAALRPGGVLLVEDADPALQPCSCLEETGPKRSWPTACAAAFATSSPSGGSTWPTAAPCPTACGPPGWWTWPPTPPSRSATRPASRSRWRRSTSIRDQLARPRNRHRRGDRAAPGQRGRRAGST